MSDWHLIISCIQYMYIYIASLNILDLFRFSIEDGQGSLSTNAGTNCSAEQLKAPQLLHPYHFHGHIAILYKLATRDWLIPALEASTDARYAKHTLAWTHRFNRCTELEWQHDTNEAIIYNSYVGYPGKNIYNKSVTNKHIFFYDSYSPRSENSQGGWEGYVPSA